ncbi:MAG: hypothetical protein HW421_1062 [Ignavibacteria bacterium]|nr:hypothetical protein [Ignavibacteria bacterium]
MTRDYLVTKDMDFKGWHGNADFGILNLHIKKVNKIIIQSPLNFSAVVNVRK